MKPDLSILILGGHGTTLASLAERVRRLGYRTIRARTAAHAIQSARDRDMRIGALLIDPELDVSRLKEDLHSIRRGGSPVLLAAGSPASARKRRDLRNAGVELALWTPIGDHALRFQLNRALSGRDKEALRSVDRVPTEWRARIFSGGREKQASVYCLSCGGAFLETGRPSLAGAKLAVELGLPGGPVTLAGEVLYTNVPGNLRRHSLPNGMAVQFTDLPDDAYSILEDSVESGASSLLV